MKPLHQEKTLPNRVLSHDGIVEGEQFVIQCPQETNRSNTPITYPNAVYSVYPNGTSMLA